MTVKREREETEFDSIVLEKCLMLLNRVGESDLPKPARVFECNTCNKKFSSFQALGGHRASHKRPKLTDQDGSTRKAKTHECSICGVEFAIGQALGGHMRRHRSAVVTKVKIEEKVAPILLRRLSSKRVMGLDLNLSLSLMPYENDGLELDLKLGHERW